MKKNVKKLQFLKQRPPDYHYNNDIKQISLIGTNNNHKITYKLGTGIYRKIKVTKILNSEGI